MARTKCAKHNGFLVLTHETSLPEWFDFVSTGYGVTSDEHTTFINASMCDMYYTPINPPVIFDIEIPDGFTKADLDLTVKVVPGSTQHTLHNMV